jgi:hypothetical protein
MPSAAPTDRTSSNIKVIYNSAKKMSYNEFEVFLSSHFCNIRRKTQKRNVSELATGDLIVAVANINKEDDQTD